MIFLIFPQEISTGYLIYWTIDFLIVLWGDGEAFSNILEQCIFSSLMADSNTKDNLNL
jgi:hypothetical protein